MSVVSQAADGEDAGPGSESAAAPQPSQQQTVTGAPSASHTVSTARVEDNSQAAGASPQQVSIGAMLADNVLTDAEEPQGATESSEGPLSATTADSDQDSATAGSSAAVNSGSPELEDDAQSQEPEEHLLSSSEASAETGSVNQDLPEAAAGDVSAADTSLSAGGAVDEEMHEEGAAQPVESEAVASAEGTVPAAEPEHFTSTVSAAQKGADLLEEHTATQGNIRS